MRLTPVIVLALLLAPASFAASPPSQPTGLTAAQGGVGEIVLTWSPPLSSGSSPVAGYSVYRSLTPTGLAHLVDLGNTLTFTDTGIPDGAPRYYRVSARNADGEGPLSASVTASAKAPPTQPRAVSAVPWGHGNISVNWTAPEFDGSGAITAYNVYRATAASGPFGFLASEPTRQYIDGGHADNVTFHYRVSAVNAYGEGPLSEIFSGHTPSRPGPVVNLTASFFPLFGIQLLWEPPYDDGGDAILRYHIYRRVGTGAEEHYAAGAPWTTAFTDRECPLAQECHYRIRARNDVGISDWSQNVTGLGDSPPIIG